MVPVTTASGIHTPTYNWGGPLCRKYVLFWSILLAFLKQIAVEYLTTSDCFVGQEADARAQAGGCLEMWLAMWESRPVE